jgi:putative transposase
MDAFIAAVERYGKPDIINSDQGSQYTSNQRTKNIESQLIKISMKGKGRATDNIWIEGFWKTIKYNYLTFHPAETGLELYKNVDYYFNY